MSAGTRLRDRLAEFGRDRRGGLAIMMAGVMPMIFMLGGGAVDLTRTEMRRAHLQDALDAAVLAGAQAPSGEEVERAQEVFAANKGDLEVTPVFETADGRVSSAAVVQVPTAFLPIIGVAALPARAESVAYAGSDSPFCLLLLEPEKEEALVVNSNSTLLAEDCGVRVNSSNGQKAVMVKSNSTIRASSTCVNGHARVNAGSQIIPAASRCAPAPNPMAEVDEPVVPGECVDVVVNSNRSRTLAADACYRNVTVKANSSLVIEPGVVRITGKFHVNSNSSATAEGVTLFFSGRNAFLEVNSNSAFTLRAPSTGPTAGLAMFQNHDPAQSSSTGYLLNSNVTGTLEGLVYLPNSDLVVNSNVTSDASWTLVIARTLDIDSNATVTLNDDYRTGPPLPDAFRRVRLESEAPG